MRARRTFQRCGPVIFYMTFGFYKKVIVLFLLAFSLNYVWEHAHAVLYVHYKGGPITNFILFKAAVFDAVFITILGVAFMRFSYFVKRPWLIIVAGILFAVGLEWYALFTNRWMYNSLMHIIPFFQTGLAPTMQLGLTAYITLKLAAYVEKAVT